VDGQQLTTVAVVSVLAATVVMAQSNRRRSGVIQRRSGRSGLVVVVNRRGEIAVRFGAEAFQHSSPILRRHISHAPTDKISFFLFVFFWRGRERISKEPLTPLT
jgi:hypothetical protein